MPDMKPNQLDIFGSGPTLPDGFRYRSDVVSPDHECRLIERIRALPFKEFQFHGFVGKRRTVSFGWHYDFNERVLRKIDDMPDFLVALRQDAAAFAGLPPEQFQHVLVTEYDDGAGIGWHKDKAVFGEVNRHQAWTRSATPSPIATCASADAPTPASVHARRANTRYRPTTCPSARTP